MQERRKKLGEILISKGLITNDQLDIALAEQAKSNVFLGIILVKKLYVKEKELSKALSDQFNIPLVSLENMPVDLSLTKQFSSSLVMDNKCFPIKSDDYSVTFAIINPLDVWAINKAEQETGGRRAKFVIVTPSDMEEITKRYVKYKQAEISKLF